jgi:hypothetical protein
MILNDFTWVVLVFGLVAFVPNDIQNPTSMTILLVNPISGHCVHGPKLIFPKVDTACDPRCDSFSADFYEVALGAVDITFSSELQLHDPTQGLYGNLSHTELPVPDPNATGYDFFYVPRISDIDGRPVRLKNWNLISSKVGARIEGFGWDKAESCQLETEDPMRESPAHSFAFVDSLHEVRSSHHQAIAKIARFYSKIRSRSNSFKLTIMPRPESRDTPRTVTFTCSAGTGICPSLAIGNAPLDPSCGSLVLGEHFFAYDELVDDSKGLAPFILNSLGKSVKLGNKCQAPKELIEALVDARTAGGRPICPMAIVDP